MHACQLFVHNCTSSRRGRGGRRGVRESGVVELDVRAGEAEEKPPAPHARGVVRGRRRAEDDALTFHIALKYFAENKSVQEIANELRLERTFISRRLQEAKLRGMVHILVTPPAAVHELRGLERRLKAPFPPHQATV